MQTQEWSSIASYLASLPERERRKLLRSLSPKAAELARYHWPLWSRPKQRAPAGKWRFWLIQAGRGFGKTRAGAEWIRERVNAGARRIALVGATAADVRDTMIEGNSGILAVFPPDQRPLYEPSKRRITFHTGAIATAFTADEPERLRGPEHDTAWADELAAWRYSEAWDQLNFTLRVGDDPRCVITTTPQPKAIIIKLCKDPSCVVTRGGTFENRENLAEAWFDQIIRKYQGTTLGRQELDGELFLEMPGALWKRITIEDTRVSHVPPLVTRILAIDPSLSGSDDACEVGMVEMGIAEDRDIYVLEDYSFQASPNTWARLAIGVYRSHSLDRIVVETNAGAQMISTILRSVERDLDQEAIAQNGTRGMPAAIQEVRAREGKRARAAPVAALYEQKHVHHTKPFPDLEDQLCTYVEALATESPDRLDATVWGVTALTQGMPIEAPVDTESAHRESPWEV